MSGNKGFIGIMDTTLSLGMRNNNPLNIRVTKDTWKGQVTPKQGEFCQFESLEYGMRAAAMLLFRYMYVYRLYTPREIITRWAPPADGNNVEAYCKAVYDYTARAQYSGNGSGTWYLLTSHVYLSFFIYNHFKSIFFAMAHVESRMEYNFALDNTLYGVWLVVREQYLKLQ